MLNTMVSFVILLISCTARIACADGQTDTQTHIRTYKTTTVPLAVHARRRLINSILLYICMYLQYTMKSTKVQTLGGIWRMVYILEYWN